MLAGKKSVFNLQITLLILILLFFINSCVIVPPVVQDRLFLTEKEDPLKKKEGR